MDYLSYFGLRADPFSHAPSPGAYYASSQHTNALDRLTWVVKSMRGLAVVVGDIGHGKSTLARRLLDLMPEQKFQATMLVIVHAGITGEWLLRHIAIQLGVEQPGESKLEIISQVRRRLMAIHAEGRKAVVLIDEAQMLDARDIMEELRGLTNIEIPGQKLITFVLFGLTDLEEHLALDPPLQQRVALRCRLESFKADDTHAYVRHRMRVAGAASPVFTNEALDRIQDVTGGVPRLINTLADNTLLELFFMRSRRATPEVVEAAARNIGLHIPEPKVVEMAKLPNIYDDDRTPLPGAVLALDASPQLGFSAEEIAQRVATEIFGSGELRSLVADDVEPLRPAQRATPESAVNASPVDSPAVLDSGDSADGNPSKPLKEQSEEEGDVFRRALHERVLEDTLTGQEH